MWQTRHVERNTDIVQRARAGQDRRAIAAACKISAEQVRQIVEAAEAWTRGGWQMPVQRVGEVNLFPAVCRAAGLPEPVPELRFSAPRRWRFDWAWPELKLALEVQGGIFSGGRHVRGAALLKEMEKLNAAAIAGYRVLYVTPATLLTDGPELVRRAHQHSAEAPARGGR